MSVDQIASEALRLPTKERALLAESLWESLDNPIVAGTPSDDAAVAMLALQRDREIESGHVQPIAHDELMSRLRR
ncbi:MAG TPA: addiction module protein [Verrucomicrobiae bacterium]|jgi:putative addiction module component (TIGR02574 family)